MVITCNPITEKKNLHYYHYYYYYKNTYLVISKKRFKSKSIFKAEFKKIKPKLD